MQILETLCIYKRHLSNDSMLTVVSHSIQLIDSETLHTKCVIYFRLEFLFIVIWFWVPSNTRKNHWRLHSVLWNQLFCNPNIIHTKGLKFILRMNPKYCRKSLWTEKQKQFSLLLSLFCHHRNTVYLIAKYYILWGYLYMVFMIKSLLILKPFKN